MTKEIPVHAVSTPPHSDTQLPEYDTAELYGNRQRPGSGTVMCANYDRGYHHRVPDEEPGHRRVQRSISPWSSFSDDGDERGVEVEEDEDDDYVYKKNGVASTHGSRQETPTVRDFLLAESGNDNRKVRLLQEWIRDYGDIVRQLRNADSSGPTRRSSDRSCESEMLHDITVAATRVELGPRSITDRAGRLNSPIEGYFRQPMAVSRADVDRVYMPAVSEGRQRLPERLKDSEDVSTGSSRTIQHGGYRDLRW